MENIEPHLRAVIVQCLQRKRPTHTVPESLSVPRLIEEVATFAKTHNLKVAGYDPWINNGYGTPEPSPHFGPRVWDVVWDLIVEGILRPGRGTDKLELPALHVTDYGKAALADATTPYDPDGFLKALTEAVPAADPEIVAYIGEAAKTLRSSCLLSSTFMIGLASEKLLLMMVDALAMALNPADSTQFITDVKGNWMIKHKYDVFKRWSDTKLKPAMKAKGALKQLMNQFDDGFNLIAPYFRDLRNTAGHPSATTFTRDRVLSHLILFPSYLRSMYKVIDWMGTNKPL